MIMYGTSQYDIHFGQALGKEGQYKGTQHPSSAEIMIRFTFGELVRIRKRWLPWVSYAQKTA